MNKNQMTEFSFEKENQPVCSSVSSCLMLNTSAILMSSLSSLITPSYNSVSRGCFSVSLDKMRIINKENKCVTHVQMHFP